MWISTDVWSLSDCHILKTENKFPIYWYKFFSYVRTDKRWWQGSGVTHIWNTLPWILSLSLYVCVQWRNKKKKGGRKGIWKEFCWGLESRFVFFPISNLISIRWSLRPIIRGFIIRDLSFSVFCFHMQLNWEKPLHKNMHAYPPSPRLQPGWPWIYFMPLATC